MEDQQERDETYEKFTWTIQNFSKLNSMLLSSKSFVVGGYPWRIVMQLYDDDDLTIDLGPRDYIELPNGCSVCANFRLAVINQVNGKMTKIKETQRQMTAISFYQTCQLSMCTSELCDPSSGFVVNDTCIIVAEVSVRMSGHEYQVEQADIHTPSLESGGQAGEVKVETPHQEDQGRDLTPVSTVSAQVSTEPIDNRLPKEMSSDSFGELMDFRGLGKIENGFVQLLEEVCSRHSSLIECQQKRSLKFTEWAFTALGTVLHFLKTKKVSGMNDDGCKDLQNLWEELETCGFDLSWLQPHVESALGMKSYMGRAVEVKKRKENVAALEMETKRLKTAGSCRGRS